MVAAEPDMMMPAALPRDPSTVSEKSSNEKAPPHDKDPEEKVDFTDVQHLNEKVLAVDMHIGDVFEDKRAIDLDSDGKERPIETDADYALRLLSIEDDDTLPIFTIRTVVLSIGLSCFGAVLGQLFFFRPQTIYVSQLFLQIIGYILGRVMQEVLPGPGASVEKLRQGDNWFYRFLNPGPFNIKEHVAILIMSGTASDSALGISIFAAQDLYYDVRPNVGVGIFTLISSQLIGYSLAGISRSYLVWPTYAVYPHIVPQVQLFDLLHRGKGVALQAKRWKIFWIVFIVIFVWEWVPEYIAPTLTGVSIFCLANQDSPWFTRVFGGAAGNEGLGMFSLCFDWAYLGSGGGSIGALFTPLSTQLSLYGGCAVCIIAFCACYANNIWHAQNFPFLSQLLFYQNGTEYDQLSILNDNFELDHEKLAEQGLPWYAASQLLYRVSRTMYIGAAIAHFGIWHAKDVWNLIRNGKEQIDDVHYQIMRKYPEVPWYWYGGLGVATFAMAMACIYTSSSGMPWWALILALVFAAFFMPIIGTLYCTVGYAPSIEFLIQMLGGAVMPGKPVANMYFTLYGFQPVYQGYHLLRDLKLGQYTKLPPRITFFCQCLGSIIGALLNLVIMKSVLSSQREILRDVQGSNVWSGQQVQSYNSDAVAWGALGKPLYAPGTPYAFVPYMLFVGLAFPFPFWFLHRYQPKFGWNKVFTPILVAELGYLAVGINSSVFGSFLLAVFSQYYLRKYHARWFRKYNFLISAALDGGTQVMIFIWSFAVGGASGTDVPFPVWALNPKGNPDYCKRLTD